MDNWKTMEEQARNRKIEWPEEDESWRQSEGLQINATDADLNFDSLSENSKKDKEEADIFSDTGSNLQQGAQTSGLSDGMEYLTTSEENEQNTKKEKQDDSSQEGEKLHKWMTTNLIFIANNLPKVSKCHIDLDSKAKGSTESLVEKANYLASIIQYKNQEIKEMAEMRIKENDVEEHEKKIKNALELRKKQVVKLETLRDTIFNMKRGYTNIDDVGKRLKDRKSYLQRLYRFAEIRKEETSVHLINRLILDSSLIRGTREYSLWEQEQTYNIIKPTLKESDITQDMLNIFEDHIKHGVIFNWKWLKETLLAAMRYSSAKGAQDNGMSVIDKNKIYRPTKKHHFQPNNAKRSNQWTERYIKLQRTPGRHKRHNNYDTQQWITGFNRLKRPYKESESTTPIKRRR